MSVPQPRPRRRPIALLVVGVVALLDGVLALLGIAQEGSSALRWLNAGLWWVLVLVCAVGWRRQVRRFDEETAALARASRAADEPEASPPTS